MDYHTEPNSYLEVPNDRFQIGCITGNGTATLWMAVEETA
jgi:hypothetical protein